MRKTGISEYIYLHGFASGPGSFKAKKFKQAFRKKGIQLHVPDLNGGDFSRMTLSSQMEIIRNTAGGCSGNIRIIGSSLGGYLASLYALEDRRVEGVFLMAPAFHFFSRQKKRLGREALAKWKSAGSIPVYHSIAKREVHLSFDFVKDQKKYPDRIQMRDIPTMIVHGINDDVVDYKLSVNHLNQYPGTRLLLIHSDHSLSNVITEILEQSFLFFNI